MAGSVVGMAEGASAEGGTAAAISFTGERGEGRRIMATLFTEGIRSDLLALERIGHDFLPILFTGEERKYFSVYFGNEESEMEKYLHHSSEIKYAVQDLEQFWSMKNWCI